MNKIQLLESLGVCFFSTCGSIKALKRLLSAVDKAAVVMDVKFNTVLTLIIIVVFSAGSADWLSHPQLQ